MIIPPGPLKVMVATKPVDFRKGAVSLAALVEYELGLKPFSGVVFIFRSKRANRIKLLVWDGTGLVLVSKVLQTGGFHWPRAHDGVMRLSASQASALFEGLQWSKMHTPRTHPPHSAPRTDPKDRKNPAAPPLSPPPHRRRCESNLPLKGQSFTRRPIG
ncbi:IS66 family insertion sequence element accessory protein TnpB [Sphingobium sp. AS12]|nr:IS66 family insertion sequence element accessory protein TnpB [Sphingobium sp. AS12]